MFSDTLKVGRNRRCAYRDALRMNTTGVRDILRRGQTAKGGFRWTAQRFVVNGILPVLRNIKPATKDVFFATTTIVVEKNVIYIKWLARRIV